MHTTQHNNPQTAPSSPSSSGFQPIPTRIKDLAPLVVEPIANEPNSEVLATLEDLDAKLAEIHRTSAEAYMSQGSYEQALGHLEAAATFAPEELEYHNQLGFVRYLQGNDQGAVECFQKVLAGQPTNAEASFNLGMVLFGQQQFADAEGCFAHSLQGNPNDSQTWNNRGVCLYQIGQVDAAKACFQKALQIDPNDADAQVNIASMG